jgi:hypothetical protein
MGWREDEGNLWCPGKVSGTHTRKLAVAGPARASVGLAGLLPRSLSRAGPASQHSLCQATASGCHLLSLSSLPLARGRSCSCTPPRGRPGEPESQRVKNNSRNPMEASFLSFLDCTASSPLLVSFSSPPSVSLASVRSPCTAGPLLPSTPSSPCLQVHTRS